jgi:hypothetical protein
MSSLGHCCSSGFNSVSLQLGPGHTMLLPTVLSLLLLLALCAGPWVQAAKLADEIHSLPGWSPKPLPSKQFSGFVNATADGQIQMHYWFIEAETNPADAPLLLWFNGGSKVCVVFVNY